MTNDHFSVEVASYRMTKNEFSKLYLSGDATKGLEKFNIPTGAPVVYEVTMLKFDRVRKCSCIQLSFHFILGERYRSNHR